MACPVTFAEVAPGYADLSDLVRDWHRLGIRFDPITPEAAYLAGQVFLAYRREGGPRQHLLPDFIVAAHASAQADRLAAVDRGYLRRYFPDLPLLRPG